MSVVTKEMLDAAVIVGRNQERERIIKLLEKNAVGDYKKVMLTPQLIAFIKGELQMSEYIPTKVEVRSQYADDAFGSDEYLANVAEFDRWLEAHNASVIKETEERIAKAIEERFAENVDHCEWGTHIFLDNAIALIKGENK